MSGPLDPFAELWQHEREQMSRLNPPSRRLPPGLSDFNISAQPNFMRDNTSLLANGPGPKLGNIHRPSRSDPDWFPTTSRYDNPDSPLFRPTAPDSAGPSSNASAPRPFGVDETSTSQNVLAPRPFGLNEPSTSQNAFAPQRFGLNELSTSFAPRPSGLNPPSTSQTAFAPRSFGLNEPSTSFAPRPFALDEPSTSRTVFAPRPSGLNEPSTSFAPRPFALDEPRNSRNVFAPRPFGLNASSTSRNGFASRPFGLTGEASTLDNTFYHSRPRVQLHPMPGTEEEKFKKLEATFLAGEGQDSSSTATRKRPLEISDEDDECPYRPQQSQNTPYGLTIAKSCPPLEQKEATDLHTLVSDTARIEHPSHEFTLRVPTTPQVHPPGSWPERTSAATRFADLTNNYVPEQALDPASSWAGLTARLTRLVGNNMTRRANNTARAVRGVGNHITQRATKTARVVRVVGHDISQRATITARRAVNVVGTFKRRIQQVLHRDTDEHGPEDHRRGPPADSDMPLLDAASVVDDALSSDVMDATPEPLHPVEMPSPADGIFELVEIDFSGFNFWSSRSDSSDTPSSGSATKPKSLKRAAPESEDTVHPSKKSETRAPMAFSPLRTRGSFVRKMFPPAHVGSLAVAEAIEAHRAGDPMPLKRINYRRRAYFLPFIRVPSTEVKETASQRPKTAQSQEVKTKSILKTSSNAVASSSKSSVVDATTVSFSDANHEKHTPKPKPSRKVHFPNSPVTGERIITPRNAPAAPWTPSPSPSPPRARIGHLQHLLDAHARNILSSEETDVKAITDEEQKENIAPMAPDTTSRDLMSPEVTSRDLMSTEVTPRDMLSNEYMRTEDTNIEHVNTNQTTADEVISHEGRYVIAQESNMLSQDPSTQEAEQHPMGRALSAVSMFYPTPSPIPVGRTESLLAKSWRATVAENEEKEGKRRRQSQQRPPARILLERPAVRPLSAKWIKRLEDTMTGPPSRKVATTLSGETLTTRDLATCYTPLEWLNDEVINAYMALIIDYLRRTNNNSGRHDKPRYHAFNSFFFSNLRDKGYESVRRWATRAKIGGKALLNVDTVFVPIHDKSHWTLIVVKPCDRTIEHFDSLGGLNRRHVNLIKTWLGGELGEGFVEAEWKVLPSLSPRQDNGSDCGVFLLSTAKAVAINLEPQSYGAPDSPLLRQKIVGELMNGGLDGDFNPVQGRGVML